MPPPPSTPPGPEASLAARGAGALQVIAFGVVVALLYVGRDVLVPFAMALLLAMFLDPGVQWLIRRRVPRLAAVALVLLCAVITLGALSSFVTSQLLTLSQDLPQHEHTLRAKLQRLKAMKLSPSVLDGALGAAERVGAQLNEARLGGAGPQRPGSAGSAPVKVQIEPEPTSQLATAGELVRSAFGPLAMVGVVLVFVIFILLERNDLRDRLLRLSGRDLRRNTETVNEAARLVKRYLQMQWLVNLCYGVPLSLGLWWLGVPGWLLWGLLGQPAALRALPRPGHRRGVSADHGLRGRSGLEPAAVDCRADPGAGAAEQQPARALVVRLEHGPGARGHPAVRLVLDRAVGPGWAGAGHPAHGRAGRLLAPDQAHALPRRDAEQRAGVHAGRAAVPAPAGLGRRRRAGHGPPGGGRARPAGILRRLGAGDAEGGGGKAGTGGRQRGPAGGVRHARGDAGRTRGRGGSPSRAGNRRRARALHRPAFGPRRGVRPAARHCTAPPGRARHPCRRRHRAGGLRRHQPLCRRRDRPGLLPVHAQRSPGAGAAHGLPTSAPAASASPPRGRGVG